jgi:prophage maintenance system killer protein
LRCTTRSLRSTADCLEFATQGLWNRLSIGHGISSRIESRIWRIWPLPTAAYAVGLAKNHPFIDGNKRVSYVVTRTFLVLNDSDLHADAAERVRVWLAIADGTSKSRLLTGCAGTWLRKVKPTLTRDF